MPARLSRLLVFCGATLAAAGCDDGRAITLPPKPAAPRVIKKVVVRHPSEAAPQKRVASRGGSGPQSPATEDVQKELDIISREYDRTQNRNRGSAGVMPSFPSLGSSRYIGSGGNEDAAIRKIGAAIKESVELGPTLVVWLIDRTPSAQSSLSGAVRAVVNYYETPEVKAWPAGQLQSAALAFDEQVSFVLDPPGDGKQAQEALSSIQSSKSGREMTCTAIKQALEKYQSARTQDRREVLLVAITDEAGDDRAVADDVLVLARRNAIPIYVIGLPAPWGQTNPQAADPKVDPKSADDSLPTYGPESAASERVDISGWAGGSSSDLIDSGFGPFVLERICRGSRGQFLAIRSSGIGGGSWPPPGAQQFDEKSLNKYAPDYVSDSDFQKLLAQNKAFAALVAAAKLPRVVVEGQPELRFSKGTEAQNQKRFSEGQKFPARNLPRVDKLYDELAPGEGDRDKLTSPRLQAEFDLAMGRVCAIKARLDGYNSMLAALKRGKNFQNAGSTTWSLEPADTFETESTIKRLGERAKMYLERVVKEHPGTPWARIAEEELRSPMGWIWRES